MHRRTVRPGAARMAAVSLVLICCLLSGCARITTGSVGIVRHWVGEISTEPATGFKWTIFDSIVADIDTTETRVPLTGLRPSDTNGVLLDALDVVVSFRLMPDKVPAFYIQTKELDTYVDDANRTVTTVGLAVMKNIVQHSIQEVTKREIITELAANLGDYENKILLQAQQELDAGYPGVFRLIRINVNHFTPPAAIREQVNAIASLKVEAQRIAQAQTLIDKQAQLESAKAVLEANALRAAADASHLSPQELIAWKNARAYEIQARAIADSATKTIDVTRQPAVPSER